MRPLTHPGSIKRAGVGLRIRRRPNSTRGMIKIPSVMAVAQTTPEVPSLPDSQIPKQDVARSHRRPVGDLRANHAGAIEEDRRSPG